MKEKQNFVAFSTTRVELCLNDCLLGLLGLLGPAWCILLPRMGPRERCRDVVWSHYDNSWCIKGRMLNQEKTGIEEDLVDVGLYNFLPAFPQWFLLSRGGALCRSNFLVTCEKLVVNGNQQKPTDPSKVIQRHKGWNMSWSSEFWNVCSLAHQLSEKR